jgi:hypothetical protein
MFSPMPETDRARNPLCQRDPKTAPPSNEHQQDQVMHEIFALYLIIHNSTLLDRLQTQLAG